jgi:hypothetical protein
LSSFNCPRINAVLCLINLILKCVVCCCNYPSSIHTINITCISLDIIIAWVIKIFEHGSTIVDLLVCRNVSELCRIKRITEHIVCLSVFVGVRHPGLEPGTATL